MAAARGGAGLVPHGIVKNVAGVLENPWSRTAGFIGLRASGFIGLRASGFIGLRASGFIGLRASGFIGLRASGFRV